MVGPSFSTVCVSREYASTWRSTGEAAELPSGSSGWGPLRNSFVKKMDPSQSEPVLRSSKPRFGHSMTNSDSGTMSFGNLVLNTSDTHVFVKLVSLRYNAFENQMLMATVFFGHKKKIAL